MNEQGRSITFRITGLIIVCILLYFILKYTFGLLYPFFISFGLAMTLHPFVTFLESNWRFPRAFATLFMMLVMFAVLTSTIFMIITELVQGAAFLADKVPTHFQSFMTVLNHFINENILPYYDKITSFFKTLNTSQQDVINQYIQQLTSEIGSAGASLLQKIFLTIPTMLSMIPQSMTVFIVIILATFFMTNDLQRIRAKLRKIIPIAPRASTVQVLQHLRTLLFGYVKAQFIIVSITAFMIFIGLLIIKMEHALTIAILAAIVDLLPLIGTGIIFIPWLLYAFLVGNYELTIQLSLLYSFIIIVRQIIEPKVLSNQLGVKPLITLVVMFAGFQLWGIVGIIIAPFLIVLYNALKRAGVINQVVHFIKG